ncbi:MAG TPA: NAD(P)-dependent oxidoreductase [Acidimicrobiales bacterium]|nr:NAD(P)-dependent oxidoreductase [Acidimicrobiales bacterium]
MTVLVTGGAGFIGRHLAEAFHAAGDEVVAMRHRRPVDRAELPGERDGAITAVWGDVTDGDQVLAVVQEQGIESIVHLASPSLGDTYGGAGIDATVAGLVRVMEVARSLELGRVSIASSVSVYSGATAVPFREDAPLRVGAGDAIGALKRATEELAIYYSDRTGLDVVLLRIGEVYGPLYRSMRNYPSRVARVAARGEGHRVGPAVGVDGHDYCYVKDCAEAIRLLHVAPHLSYRTYNVGGGRAVADREVLAAARAVCPDLDGSLVPIAQAPAPDPGAADRTGDESSYMDLGRLRDATGIVPRYDVDLGMAEYIEWLGSHDY